MVNYNKGKIYKIECLTTGLIYVGSTTKDYLSQRLTKHICAYRQYLRGTYRFTTSFKIIENNNYRIELLEEVNCQTKDQLLIREGHYIRTLECVNKYVMGRTNEDAVRKSKEYYGNNQDKIKQYYQDNKEIKLKQHKEYRIAHKDEIKEKSHQRYEENKETLLKLSKQYKDANKEILKQKATTKINCLCGSEIRHSEKARHAKSKKHQAYLETLNN